MMLSGDGMITISAADARMGMDLDGAGGYFRWTWSGWRWVTGLAEEFGWVPSQTGPPRGMLKAAWCGDGEYWSNDGQRFYARDAAGFADALERALAAIPEQEPPKQGQFEGRYFTADEAASLREFVAYCRAGSFRLH